MRKILIAALFFCGCSFAFAQEMKFFASESAHYRVSSETSQSQADEVSRIMEASLSLYNGIFHFDLSQLPGKLQVKVFKSVDTFNGYLNNLLSQTRSDFVFVSYADPSKSELLAFTKDAASFLPSLIHQGCIQFLKAFIANPPVWLREGVATYLEASQYDSKTTALTFKANYLWLDSLKAIMRGEGTAPLIPFSDFLLLNRDTAQAQLDVFYPEAWGLVTFLLRSPDTTDNRIIWDAISVLDPKASLDDNSQAVRRRAFSWVSDQTLAKSFASTIESLKTPQELLRGGVDFYAKGDLDQAEKSFLASLEQEPGSNAAYYYLGLIAYSRKDYSRAEQMYGQAAKLGIPTSLVDYALGVNAFAGGKLADAANYLKLSKDADPKSYGDKVDVLLKRIDAMKN